jgi:hypothetical protein
MVMTEVMGAIPLMETDDATVTHKTTLEDSDTSCTPATRLKYEFSKITLPSIPTSAAQLGDFQYVVAQTVVLASGRGDKRMAWFNEIVTARSPDELWHVPTKRRSLDLKLTVAAMTACEDVPAIYNVLRREGMKVHKEMRILNGRQCVWYIYKHFASPNVSQHGLKVSYTVIDLTRAKLRYGDKGLVEYWDKWIGRISNIRRLPRRSEYQDIFVDEMRKSDVMEVYVREFDDMKDNDRNKTWEWLGKRGLIMFERDHERKNQRRVIGGLNGLHLLLMIVFVAIVLLFNPLPTQKEKVKGKTKVTRG